MGLILSDKSVFDARSSTTILISAMIGLDAGPQVKWQARGYIRNGGTLEQLEDVVSLAKEACAVSDMVLRNAVPDLRKVIEAESVFDE